jgi:transmembrane sensor
LSGLIPSSLQEAPGMALDETISEQAVAWAVRTGDPGFDDWEAFTTWLEQDPAHARYYDQVSASIADAVEVVPPTPAADNDDEPPPGVQRRWWLRGPLPAAAAALVAMGVWQARPSDYTVETAPGEARMVELDGRGRIELAGGTHITLDRDNPRKAVLAYGQAVFTIDHDPAAPFTVTVGEDTLVDIGTVFEVTHAGGRMALAVSEGAVVFNPARQNVRVSPGKQLVSATGSDAYELGDMRAQGLGEWREGRVTFEDATLSEVAADLSRIAGIPFAVSPTSPESRVSGSLLLEPIRSDPRALGPLLGVTVRRKGEAWELSAN